MSAPLFLDWPAAWAAGPATAGGKGWNLARLDRYGFAVPSGGVLAVAAWEAFAAAHGLAPMLDALAANEDDPATGAALEQCILAAPLPLAVEAAVDDALGRPDLAGRPLAVRSSAVGEDSTQASFAGILASSLQVLDRDGVLAAIRRCWASAWSPRALAYRRRLGLAAGSGAPAVVVMAMAPALSAGAAFSCDPRNGREDRVFVSANFGLGESVVGGLADPDEWVVDIGFHAPRMAIAEARAGRKEVRCEARPEGGTAFACPSGATNEPALPEAALLQLARMVVRVRDALGHGELHQDVEWTWDGARLWLVQARPVTIRPAYTYPALAGRPTVWSNGNIRDSLPMVIKPLTWSLAPHLMDAILLATHHAAGTPVLPGLTRSRLYRGRGYFNVSVLQWEYLAGFGIAPAVTNRFMGGHQADLALAAPAGLARRLARLGANLRLARVLARARTTAPHRMQEMRSRAEAARRQDWAAASDAELATVFIDGLEDYAGYRDLHLVHGASAGTYLLLTSLLGLWLAPTEGETLARALLADAAPITSAEHGQRLAELAATAESDPAALAYLQSVPLDPMGWQALPPDSPFRSALAEFLAEYGHRSVYELDVANPRWHEDPSWLLETLRGHLGSATLAAAESRRKQAAGQAWQTLKERLPALLRPVVLPLVRGLIRHSAFEAAQREAAKSAVVYGVEVERLASREIGRRLVARGLLGERDDVDFLSLEDLLDLLSGAWDGHGARALVADRARRHAELARDPAPPDLLEDDAPRRAPPRPAQGAAPPGSLAGLAVAAGVARGTARLVRHPTEGARLGQGEILVAPSTDPAWTPLFLRAAALVTESGGFISHGAIVAREYGLPAVVNVAGALDLLEDGRPLEVDGDRGWVRPL